MENWFLLLVSIVIATCSGCVFTERIVTTIADGARGVFVTDVDGDGDVDALSASAYDDTIAWYENDGSQSFAERVITAAAIEARSVSSRRRRGPPSRPCSSRATWTGSPTERPAAAAP